MKIQDPSMLEKDYFVLMVICALSQLNNSYFFLIFQGGTCLSKAHKLIDRMSEDVDFRIVLKEPHKNISNSARQKGLRIFRDQIIKALHQHGFLLINTPETGTSMKLKLSFQSVLSQFHGAEAHGSYLKPYIAVDLFDRELELPSETKQCTTLIKEILGEECSHSSFQISCVSVDETAVEKWVALVRRVYQGETDKELIRHLYDLHELLTSNYLSEDYLKIIKSVIQKENEKHKKQGIINYVVASSKVITKFEEEFLWRSHWDIFLVQMVYGESKPDYLDALHSFKIW